MATTQVKILLFPYYIFHLSNFANFAKYLAKLSWVTKKNQKVNNMY